MHSLDVCSSAWPHAGPNRWLARRVRVAAWEADREVVPSKVSSGPSDPRAAAHRHRGCQQCPLQRHLPWSAPQAQLGCDKPLVP